MTEPEEQAELASELIMETVKKGNTARARPNWHNQVALSTLFMALFTAVGALLAGMTAHEALLDRTQELIDVSIAENERVSMEVLKAKAEILASLGEVPSASDAAQIQAYEQEVRSAKEKAAEEEADVALVAHSHLIFAIAVTVLSAGITLAGMSIIAERKLLWVVGLALGAVGVLGVAVGVATRLS